MTKKQIRTMGVTCLLILAGLGILGFIGGNARAVTYVEGEINVDTTWTLANSPYVVSDDVFVDANATLTVEAEVIVKFGGYFSIFVEGNFSAVGTEANKITFTSNKLTPAQEDWNTIKFQGAETQSFVMKYCLVKYAKCGTTIASIGSSLIENCKFYNNTEGVRIIGKSNSQIKSNTIKFNQIGVSAEGEKISDIVVTNNILSNNSGSGIYFHGEAEHAYIYNVTITGNTVSSNGGSGIYLYAYADYYNAYIYNVTITGNTVSSNGGSGIYLHADAYYDDTYIYNVTITGNTVSSNSGSGIYLYAYAWYTDDAYIYNVAITGNTVSSNGGSGIYLYADVYYDADAYIYNVTITGNTVSSNGGSGIYLYAYADHNDDAYIYDVIITGNTISSNGGSGIYLHADAWHYDDACIYNVTITGNTVSSNDGSGIEADSEDHYTAVTFDITIQNNRAYSNERGVLVIGGVKASITNNSIAYNTLQGILYIETTGNRAAFNDIYQNRYGMKVSDGASVNAEQNYWGDSSGPYHESMNPEGQGNSVNGDGTDLDFIPFLNSSVSAINERPVAHLVADKSAVGINEDVTFDASGSTDDTKIIEYKFTYGDGNSTGWVTTSVVKHKYSSIGVYNVTLVVCDEYRVESNTTQVKITVRENTPPVLASGEVTPSSGDVNTIFYFNVTYSDAEGDSPVAKNVYINSTPHEMVWVSGSNITGALYSYRTTLSEGTYTHYFSFNDSISTTRLPASGNYSGPTVTTNQKPRADITSPSNNTTVSGTITIFGTASDIDGTIQNVDLCIDDATFSTNKLSVKGTTSWSASWDTTLYSDGIHTIYARSYDGINYSTVASVTVTVTQYIPTPPTKVALREPSSVTADSVKLSWSQNPDANFARYEIYQSTTAGNLGTLIYTITTKTTTSYIVSGLNPDTTYYFTVRVYNTDGLYSDSDQIGVETLKKPEEEPEESILTQLLLGLPIYIWLILIIIIIAAICVAAKVKKKEGKGPSKPVEPRKYLEDRKEEN